MLQIDKNLLFELHADHRFKKLTEVILSVRPVVPQYDAAKDNKTEMAYQSSLQQGFDLCLTFFDIKVE